MLKPKPDNDITSNTRHDLAKQRRDAATEDAFNRKPQLTSNNGEIEKYHVKPTNYHKGIPHDEFGIPDSIAFSDYVQGLNRTEFADGMHATFDVALGPLNTSGANEGNRSGGSVKTFFSEVSSGKAPAVRNWESPLGGHAYDLEGPDAGDVAMAPAPTLPNSELCAEMAEVYAMALLRDVPFSKFETASYGVQRFELVTSGPKPKLKAVDAGYTVGDVISSLNGLAWFDKSRTPTASYDSQLTSLENSRREARFQDNENTLSGKSLFRGSVPGAKVGPYISQFLLIGNIVDEPIDPDDQGGDNDYAQLKQAKDIRLIAKATTPFGTLAPDQEPAVARNEGYITYGAQRIDQRINAHLAGRDYMTDWPLWLDVQNGANVSGTDAYFPEEKPRFIGRPRDLATFVHFDQLYQAYFNACLLMFNFAVPFDYGFPSGKAHTTRGSFATFGGPHLLSLLTEVASRGLKAVRRQKFQHHLRCRPEQLAAMLALASSGKAGELCDAQDDIETMLDKFKQNAPLILNCIAEHNNFQNKMRGDDETIFPRPALKDIDDPNTYKTVAANYTGFRPGPDCNYLLPMAFPEGSPMHASYGAGHATVAGACSTVLKAFFEMSQAEVNPPSLARPLDIDTIKADNQWWSSATLGSDGLGLTTLYQAPSEDLPDTENHDELRPLSNIQPETLTIEGELNKLAANISIGRNMAGVHYYTDYYDSLRMGERIAVGILQEHLTCFSDPVSMRLRTFDNDTMIIYGDGKGGSIIEIGDSDGNFNGAVSAQEWWDRHIAEFQPGGTPGPI